MPSFRRLLLGLMTSLALGIAGVAVPAIPGAVQTASAQVSAEFQEALESYGHWARSARWGEVWVPDELPPDWAAVRIRPSGLPPTNGVGIGSPIRQKKIGAGSSSTIAAGRTSARSAGSGFRTMNGDRPGSIGATAAIMSAGRRCRPTRSLKEYDDEPTYWVFVSPRYLAAPRWRSYMVPQSRRAGAFGRTRVVNRSVGYGRGRAAVNPGISPAFVARASRAPVATFRVSPRVLAGTKASPARCASRRSNCRPDAATASAAAGRPKTTPTP